MPKAPFEPYEPFVAMRLPSRKSIEAPPTGRLSHLVTLNDVSDIDIDVCSDINLNFYHKKIVGLSLETQSLLRGTLSQEKSK